MAQDLGEELARDSRQSKEIRRVRERRAEEERK